MIAKGDCIEFEFIGKANGEIFDTNMPEELKKLQSKSAPRNLVIFVGQQMVVSGLDKAFEGKEVGKKYTVLVSPKEGFGARNPALIRTIPLKVFADRNVRPVAGMSLVIDNTIAHVRAVSGARVITDFNNPLAGKELEYTFTITRKVDKIEDKAKAFLEWTLGTAPSFEVKDKIIIKGEKHIEPFITMLSPRCKEIVGKELAFQLEEVKKEDKSSHQATQQSL